MSTVSFTAADVVAQVRALAAANPNYVYPGSFDGGECSYVYDRIGSDQGKGCLIGQALQALGVEREWLLDNGDNSLTGGTSASLVLRNLRKLGIVGGPIDAEAAEYLDIVQSNQDGGDAWAHAVEKADVSNNQE